MKAVLRKVNLGQYSPGSNLVYSPSIVRSPKSPLLSDFLNKVV
jgi:hypothetical protein